MAMFENYNHDHSFQRFSQASTKYGRASEQTTVTKQEFLKYYYKTTF
jgi:hypothetical protein